MAEATPANPPLAGTKNLLPTDVHATLPDRLGEHSGVSGSKMVPYTYANGQLAPGYTATRDPDNQQGRTTTAGPQWGTELGGPSHPDFTENEPGITDSAPGTVPDRATFSSPKPDTFPRDVNAPFPTVADPTSGGSNVPAWGAGKYGPPPATVEGSVG